MVLSRRLLHGMLFGEEDSLHWVAYPVLHPKMYLALLLRLNNHLAPHVGKRLQMAQKRVLL